MAFLIRELTSGRHRVLLDDARLGDADIAVALVSESPPAPGEKLRFETEAGRPLYRVNAVISRGGGRLLRLRLLSSG